MKKKLEDAMKKHYIRGVCVTSKDSFCVLAGTGPNEMGSLGKAKLLTKTLDEQMWEQFIFKGSSVFEKPKLLNTKENELMILDEFNKVYHHGVGFEKEIHYPTLRGAYGLKVIDDNIYAAGLRGSVAVHTKENTWEDLAKGQIELEGIGFKAIDGFSKDDVYVVGGLNDIWHYDGQNWEKLEVYNEPRNDTFRCECVCCGKDGLVYIPGVVYDEKIGLDKPIVVRGRDKKWEYVCISDNAAVVISSIAEFDGKIFLGTYSHGTFVLDQKDFKPTPYDFEKQITPFSARYISAGYGMMVFANKYNLAFYDGQKWHKLYEYTIW